MRKTRGPKTIPYNILISARWKNLNKSSSKPGMPLVFYFSEEC